MRTRTLAALAVLLCMSSAARAGVLRTVDDALASTFPGARIDRHVHALTPGDLKLVQQRAHARSEARLVTEYSAWHGDTLVGQAYTDRRVVRTREAVVLVALERDGSVRRVEILAFFEPPDYLAPERWLARFSGRHERTRLVPGGDIPNVAGATLTSRAVSESVRLALSWHEQFASAHAAGER